MKEQSLAMALIKSKDRIIIILVICWLSTIIGFLWYINQFDYGTESNATIETDNSGTITTGDINNG